MGWDSCRRTAGRSPQRTDGRSSPTCESSSARGRLAPPARPPPLKLPPPLELRRTSRQTSPRASSEGGIVANGLMNGALNRKVMFLLGPVTGLVMFGAVLMVATFLTHREYKEPYRAPTSIVEPTPRVDGLAA